MPRSLTPPLGLGISTRRTGLGTYVPARSLARMLSQCVRTWSRSCWVVMPSMPGAPRVAFDRPPGRRGIFLPDDLFHQFFVHCFLW